MCIMIPVGAIPFLAGRNFLDMEDTPMSKGMDETYRQAYNSK